MLAIIFLVVLCCVPFSSARDSLTTGNWIEDDNSTLVSMNGTFELGFFTPNGSSSKGRYVGIWYHKLKEKSVVWVANRDQPLNAKSARFGIPPDGKLKAWDDNLVVLLFPGEKSEVRVVKLMDSGNLVLRVNESGKNLWESFHNPTDTFLPEMKMDENLKLTSWVSPVDPAPGNYVFKQDNEDRLTISQNQNSSNIYWTSEKSWQIPHYIYAFLYNSSEPSNQNLTFEAVPSRLVMNFTGEITYLKWDNSREEWSEIWLARGDRCNVYNACGNFGTCNVNNAIMCKCLPGFVPIEQDKWNAKVFSGGCDNKSPQCGDTFLNLKMIKVRKYDKISGKDAKNCRDECMEDCSCKAYAGVAPKCWIWSGNLPSLQEEDRDGYNLFVRVLRSDLELTTRNCETCGTNMIPYPLSTGPKCGDPEYFRFNCDNDTGQVSFKVIDSSYRVSSIDPKASKFVIQVKDANCSSPSLIPQILKLKSPFSMTGVCNASKTDKFSSDSKMTLSNSVEIEISWDPPPEPECKLSADCKDWPNSNCTTRHGRTKCFCNENFKWNGQSLNCTQEHGNQKSLEIVIGISVAVALVALLCTLGCIAYLLNRTITKRTENRANWGRHLYASDSRVKHLIDSEQFKEEDKKGIDVPFFNLEDILAATDDFSDANKLGQGGFGPVYKGKFSKGQEMAIKRLSRASGQGLQEFKNEVVLIAKLQHRNLVRLLGYCVEGDEKILLYEYMPNKSLDSFIFDRTLCMLLNWEKRFDIIMGIARGLLYLHQDSRLKIIHRDLKTSNILLDDEMNPKISDFGLAKIFDSKQVEASTNRVVGTYGYMSPEYALDGYFSEKSDVFSFGVMVLEIISGKRNTGFYQSDQTPSLLGHAWKLWKEEKVLELMDQTLSETCNTNEFSRCVNVGLLCVQEDPSDRPTMAIAVLLLSSDAATMPVPKEPAFVVKRDLSRTASSSSKAEASWKNELLATIGEGR